MASSPLVVSVITVCFNASDCIERAIQSVAAQTYPHIEYIVIDGDSSDGTMTIVDKYRSFIKVVISEKDAGIYDAMNKGVMASSGDIIFFLNADDVFVNSNVIAEIVSVFNKNKSFPIVCGKVNLINVPLKNQVNLPTYRSSIKDIRAFFCHGLCQQRAFVRRGVFDKIGLFNPNYKLAGDFDWFLSIYKNGMPIKFVDDDVVNFNMSGRSHLLKKVCVWERRKIAFRKLNPLQWFWFLDRFIPNVMMRGIRE